MERQDWAKGLQILIPTAHDIPKKSYAQAADSHSSQKGHGKLLGGIELKLSIGKADGRLLGCSTTIRSR